MALKQLPALDKKQWKFVKEKLNQVPTKEEKKKAMKLVKQGRKIKTYNP